MPVKPIFEKSNVLIIGGAGFIGSHLCDELIKSSKVICIDNFISGSEENIDHLLQHSDFEFIKHDINEPIELETLPELEKFRVKFQGVQEIYYLASPTAPKEFEKNLMATALVNSLGLKNALDLARQYKAKFLFSSASVVYGPRRSNDVLFQESDLSPRASYDEGKRFAETLVRTYQQVYGLDAKIARIFRTYGPRMKLDVGHMLPDFIFSALENKDLIIYGDENFSSSFCYITDLIQGLVKLMKSGESGPINLGSDLDYKLVDIAQQIIALTNSKSQMVFREPLLFMTPLGLPDISLAKERLGWFPIMLLEDGLKAAIDYSKAYKSSLKPGTKL